MVRLQGPVTPPVVKFQEQVSLPLTCWIQAGVINLSEQGCTEVTSIISRRFTITEKAFSKRPLSH